MDEQQEGVARLGVQDKRQLFQTLLAMTERLLMLNKFPVDQEDFVLSMHPPEVEKAWRCLVDNDLCRSLSPTSLQIIEVSGHRFRLHVYPENEASTRNYGRIFIDYCGVLDLDCQIDTNRFGYHVKEWCNTQEQLEKQILQCATVIKDIVVSCNTVGQYKRVSPELVNFLPEKYQIALKDYTKASPYPDMDVSKEEVETALSTLAFASLQPQHRSEEMFIKSSWRNAIYNLEQFPRSEEYDGISVRNLGL